jgi:parallel beta-helix repeat protein
VYVYEDGQGTLEDNDISGNALVGANIKEGGNPTVRRNRITKNGSEAIWITDGGSGTFENNDLRGNTKGPWDIAEDCLSNIKRSGNIEE